MIFALATDDHGLMIFASEADAVANCEGIDVAEGGWEFFAADGVPLEPFFSKPASRGHLVVTSGKYMLRPAENATRPHLRERIKVVAYVEGIPGVASVADVERLLTLRFQRTPERRAPLNRDVRLHMRVQHILSLLVLSLLICGAAHACAGGNVPDQEHIAQWVEDSTAAVDYVFLARITRLKRSGS